MPSHVCAREMCGEGCVTIVFLVGTHIVDSWAHDYASTGLHLRQSSSGRIQGWLRDGAVQTAHAPHQSHSFYRFLWKLLFIPAHSLSISSWQLWFTHLVKFEHVTTGYWISWVNTSCAIISYRISEYLCYSALFCSKISLHTTFWLLECMWNIDLTGSISLKLWSGPIHHSYSGCNISSSLPLHWHMNILPCFSFFAQK